MITNKKKQLGGALYTFDLNDKIGGLPAYKTLNGTQDGDCPATDTLDLGFTNYGVTRGGSRKKSIKKHSKNCRTKSRKNSNKKRLYSRRRGLHSNSKTKKH